MCLDELLRKHFNLKRPIFTKRTHKKPSDDVTKSGWKAYNKLIECLYDISELTGKGYYIEEIIQELDNIINEPIY